MDTDSDSDEDCLIPARLLNLKNNSQAPFTHSQRGKCTSSSQHDSQRQISRPTPTGTGLTSSGRRELDVSAHHVPAHTARNTCRVPSSHTARQASCVVTEREWRSGHYPMEGDLLALNMVGFNLPPSRPQPSQHAPQPAQGRQVQSQVLACVERSRVVECQDVRRLLNQNEALREC
eukprot:GHVL01032849.1.p1 GENE.GHVL01032849.1~~GHVL01032849.1.p1  ORF type:complete len:176 (+),score=18.23 GHVL01032849.1:179-706(+)